MLVGWLLLVIFEFFVLGTLLVDLTSLQVSIIRLVSVFGILGSILLILIDDR